MKRLLFLVTVVAALALVTSGRALADSSLASDTNTNAVHYYLSLGDSLAASEQPNGDLTHGYAEQLFADLKANDPTLQLVKLGCSGETTHSMIFHNPCGYPHGSQLDEAVSFLHAHRRFVSLVTINIGADDLGPCLGNLDFSSTCLSTILPTTTANLATILSQLRAAAGRDVPIVGMNYYDPFLALWVLFPTPTGQLLAQASESFVVQFNDGEEATYQAAGSPVADVESAFSTTDFTLQPDGLPLNVERICQWTWMCTSSPDVHPNTVGYGVIAQAFKQAVP